MKLAAACIAFLLAFVLAMCGGPLFVADLLKPSFGGQMAFWAASAPLLIAGVGACGFLEGTAPAGWVHQRSQWNSYTVRAGVVGMLVVVLMNAVTLSWLAVAPGHPNGSLIVVGSIAGVLLAGVYVFLARQHQRLPLEPDHRTAWCSAPRLTAQLVLSETRAYLAYSAYRRPPGANGESRAAFILQTEDAGASWTQVSWRKSIWSSVCHPIGPSWPPEDIVSVEHTPQGLRITHQDQEAMFESGGEALWQSKLVDGKWSLKRLRAMDYKRADSPNPLPELPHDLPPGMQPPRFGNIAIILQT